MTAPKILQRGLLFIVSRERTTLYDLLRQTLSEESDYDVIVDRRVGERRAAERQGGRPPGGKDRRTGDRREHLTVDSEIREGGWGVVKVNDWLEAEARSARRSLRAPARSHQGAPSQAG